MGTYGKYSRIFSPNYGGYFTFASLGKHTAPGQVSIGEFMDIYNQGEEEFKKNNNF